MFTSLSVFMLFLGLTLGTAGCGKGDSHAHSHGAEGHAHQPKNGGVLVELGNHEFNLEILVEPDSGRFIVWVLDAHAENYVRLPDKEFEVYAIVGDEERLLTLAAVENKATGEVVGNTSQFSAQADWLKTTTTFSARLGEFSIRGNSFADLTFHYPHGTMATDSDHDGHDH